MNRRHLFIGSFVALLGFGSLAGLATWKHPPSPPPRVGVEPANTPIAARVAGVESELRTFKALLAAQAAAASPTAPEEPVTAAATEPIAASAESALSPEQRDQDRIEATISNLDATLSGEIADVAWERESQRSLEALLTKPEFAESRVGSVSCAQTLCRISIQHQDRTGRQKFVDGDGLFQAPFQSSGFSHYSEATHETVVYLARKGQHLPKPPRLSPG